MGKAVCIFRTLNWLALPDVVTCFPAEAALEARFTFAGRPRLRVPGTTFDYTITFPIVVTPRQCALISMLTLTGRMVFRMLRATDRLTTAPGICVPEIYRGPLEAIFAFTWFNTSFDTDWHGLHTITPQACWSSAAIPGGTRKQVAGQCREASAERAFPHIAPSPRATDDLSVAPCILPIRWPPLSIQHALLVTASCTLAAAMLIPPRPSSAALHMIDKLIFPGSSANAEATCID